MCVEGTGDKRVRYEGESKNVYITYNQEHQEIHQMICTYIDINRIQMLSHPSPFSFESLQHSTYRTE